MPRICVYFDPLLILFYRGEDNCYTPTAGLSITVRDTEAVDAEDSSAAVLPADGECETAGTHSIIRDITIKLQTTGITDEVRAQILSALDDDEDDSIAEAQASAAEAAAATEIADANDSISE
ncbi:hypothetical protein M422DRAFT_50747 [Sphaerobolus stellatus SS14]|uniref:Uncharacterized protein n=1 Tax=Sphaerobolus stellatus (strain SS14) TaxID=990650 RepID=A0A0C9UQH2_SPHS4|nr:hypothetical protein M422DRAFT_50747 [Sphaerobolus stellatus SS14]